MRPGGGALAYSSDQIESSSVRILLICHAPLAAELGASQIALGLAAGLRERGHDAVAWSPAPVPPGPPWQTFRRRQRDAVERYVAANGPFDVIDTPVTTATPALARAGLLVVRSIQPELRYLRHSLAESLRRRPGPRTLAHALAMIPVTAGILAGWRRARLILCLGHGERAWMRRHFPRWQDKLGVYVPTLLDAEHAALKEVRRTRPSVLPGPGVRFLWIGRWTAHKGIRRLQRFLAERFAAFPADTCTLAGCGPEAERDLADWARAGRVRLLPSFPRSGLPALLAAHDAGLFTSEAEGWGLSINEMLESGLPVYATPEGAAADLPPFFPTALRPFPPPPEAVLPGFPEGEPADGYEEVFSWLAIAGEYERQVLAARDGTLARTIR
jgi:glycosyltransferase involved in cell wall biosynthesis